jgi:cardiolipin synthase (CMP-forming)
MTDLSVVEEKKLLMNIRDMKFDTAFFRKLYSCEKRITLPTLFTLLRIVLAPVVVIAMVRQQWSAAFIVFIIAAATDFIDGGLARWCNNKTILGACLDPIADKILLISCFMGLALIPSPLFSVPLWFVVLIACKESIILLGTVFLLVSGSGFTVRPTKIGKASTVVQVLFIIWMFSCYFLGRVPTQMYNSLMGIMVSFIVFSFVQYVWIGIRSLLMMAVGL